MIIDISLACFFFVLLFLFINRKKDVELFSTITSMEEYSIPFVIYQTWHTKKLPRKMRDCVKSIKLDNPEFEHELYDDKDCRNFIKNNFDADVLYSYDALVPGAFKADLWRYCILYKNGGIYLDIKYKCINKFKFITLMREEHFVKDREEVLKCPAVYNALMICKPGNIIMYQCINKVVEHVKLRFYGTNALDITGPIMMMQFFNNDDRKNLQMMFHNDEYGKYYIYYLSKKILMIYPEYRSEQSYYQNIEHYSTLWGKRKIYNI
jgi:mannosyltransferase OCH1-like enzyme